MLELAEWLDSLLQEPLPRDQIKALKERNEEHE